MSTSPWESVNVTLAQNVCWICQTKFQKGKVKKVFMISQVLDYFKMNQHQNLVFNSANLTLCYNELLTFNNDTVQVVENMKKSRIEPWMSGLACSVNEECARIIELILSSVPSAAKSILNNSLPKDEKDCPPNCGCDNPWPFIT